MGSLYGDAQVLTRRMGIRSPADPRPLLPTDRTVHGRRLVLLLITAHMVAALAAPVLVRMMGRRAFLPLAAVPAASAGWLIATGWAPRSETIRWIPDLDIALAFRLDPLSWLLALIATGIGAAVLLYCARYFTDAEPGLGRFAGLLTGFAGAMVGLVLADDVMLLYTFWELTTVFSYLLIGHYFDKRAARRAAMNALLSTTAGGLAMLAGLLMLAVQAGTSTLSGILTSGIWASFGAYQVTALVLILAGAVSKSALFPTHFWLPGAMAAPTPVSAYLHAAAMVKAGVYLILRFAPVLAVATGVAIALATLGAITMLLGAWRALRQTDIKLLLAYGTVSQLGLLCAIAAIGTPGAVLAALSMLTAHALFKAPLFMVVGAIDKTYGTRDLRVLSGVGRAAPGFATVGVLSAASMAGIPPLLGFLAKEAVLTALWEGGTWQRILLVALAAGSALTVAYAWRFVHGAFGRAPGAPPVPATRVPAGMWAPAAVILLASLALIPGASAFDRFLSTAAAGVARPGEVWPPHTAPAGVHLALVPHLGVPLLASLTAIGAGILLAVLASPVARVQRALSPETWGSETLRDLVDAERGFRRIMRGIDAVAVAVTPLTQRGSLPYTLGTMLVVLLALASPLALSSAPLPGNLVLFHQSVELLVLPVAVLAALGAVRARRRLRAVFLISVTGYATALLFLTAGAPDVAATQVLVETAMTVVLVLVLRRLPIHFSRRPQRLGGLLRWGIAIGTALVLCGAVLYGADARSAAPLGPGLIETAFSIGAGRNVVNVTLVDARAWDTIGEITVLLVVATGVASLVFVTRREQKIARVSELERSRPIWRRTDPDLPRNVLDFDVRTEEDGADHRWRTWLSAGMTLAPERRMVVLEVLTRIAFPLLMMFSIYLLIAGHNLPGGGFVAGLVTGLALTLRYLAGGRYELIEAAPVQAGTVLGAGMTVAVLAGAAPLLVGASPFTSVAIHLHVPLLGEVHLVSAMVFDIGVYLVVVGVMLDLLRSLGGQLDQLQEAEADVR